MFMKIQIIKYMKAC